MVGHSFKIIPLKLKAPSAPSRGVPTPADPEKKLQPASDSSSLTSDPEKTPSGMVSMAARRVWCVADPYTFEYLNQKLTEWGWAATVIEPESLAEKDRFLSPEESHLEDLAFAIINRLEDTPEPLLLIHLALTAGARSAGHGLLLANRVWSQHPIPTIICSVDLNVARRESSRQARYSTGQAVLPLVEVGEGVETCQNGCLVLWDLLSDKGTFEESAAVACNTVKALRSGGHAGQLQLELRGELISEQTKIYRHDLVGLMASLRILEGAYRLGWVSHDDLKHIFDEIEKRNEGDSKRLGVIKQLRHVSLKMPQSYFEKAASNHTGVKVWVCDDGWVEAGWDLLLEPLLGNKFGFSVEGFSSLTSLRQELAPPPVQPAALLLDVHYVENGEIKERVTAEFLKTLKRDHPLLDVILFTSELKDGLLVREVYELGYRIFFKEVVESSRDPRTYAHKFALTVERAASSMPVRVLWELADAGSDLTSTAGVVIDTLKEKLRIWQYHPEPWMVFGITPLLEQAIKEVFANTFPGAAFPKKQIRNSSGAVIDEFDNLWKAVSQILDNDPRAPASMLCKRLEDLSNCSRNSLVHNAHLVLASKSVLPSVGLALPIIVFTLSLYEIRSSLLPAGPTLEARIEERIRKLIDALVISNRVVKNDVRTLLVELLKASTGAQLKKLVNKIFDLVSQNSHTFGEAKDDFIDGVSKVKYGLPSHPPFRLNVSQLLIIVSAICLLDGEYAQNGIS